MDWKPIFDNLSVVIPLADTLSSKSSPSVILEPRGNQCEVYRSVAPVTADFLSVYGAGKVTVYPDQRYLILHPIAFVSATGTSLPKSTASSASRR